MAMFTINRAGKKLGPYSLGDVQRYLAEGRLGLSEPACLDGDQRWEPLQRLLARMETPARPAQPKPANFPSTVVSPGRSQGPVPPSLHWLLVFVLSVASSGLFSTIWLFVQASFVKKIDAASKATAYLAGAIACLAVFAVAVWASPNDNLNEEQVLAMLVAFACFLASGVLILMGVYSIRTSLQNYYRYVEPMGISVNGDPLGLRLSGILTFFFNVYYFQYHLSRIAKWKESGRLD